MPAPEVQAVGQRHTLKVVNVFGPAGNNLPQQSSGVLFSRKKWVEIGQSNTFPEYCMAVIANCAPLAAAAQRMSLFLTGLRYEPLDKEGKVVEEALKEYESWFGQDIDGQAQQTEKQFRTRVMTDIAHLSALAVDVAPTVGTEKEITSTSKKKIAALFHRDVTRLRVGQYDEQTKRRTHNYWSANWEKCKTKRYEPIPLPVFDPKKLSGAKVFSIYAGQYVSGMQDYFLPVWIGALSDAENWASIALHNKTQADASFSGTTMVAIPGNKDQVNLEQIDENLELLYSGPRGKKIFTVLKGNTGERVEVIPIPRGDAPGESEDLRDKSTDAILTGYHGMPKVLIGMDIDAGMGGAGLALEETWNHFLNTAVIPSQELYTNMIDTMLRLNGFENVVRGRIVNEAPWKFTDKALKAQEYMATTTVNDSLKAQGKPVLPPEDKRGSMMLKEIGQSFNIPQLLDQLGQDPAPAIPPANA